MAKDTYYFSHDYNARNDKKISALVRDYKSAGYGIYWCTAEMMHEEGGEMELDDLTISAIAKDLNEDFELVKLVIEKCISYKLFILVEDNILTANRVKRNLDKRKEISVIRSEAGKNGAIAKQKKANAKQMLANAEQEQASVQQNQAKERKGKERNNTVEEEEAQQAKIEPQLVGTDLSVSTAKLVWDDQRWREQLCMAHSMTQEDLKKWMAQFNASVANDPIPDFNAAKYKKMFGGWLNTQKGKGYKLDKNNNHSPHLKYLHPNNVSS